MSIFEYNKEEEEQKLRKAEYEAGIEAGVAEGELKKARETALSLAEMGLPVDKIAEAVKISRDKVEEWMKEMKESKRSKKVRQDIIMINTSEILIFMLYIL